MQQARAFSADIDKKKTHCHSNRSTFQKFIWTHRTSAPISKWQYQKNIVLVVEV